MFFKFRDTLHQDVCCAKRALYDTREAIGLGPFEWSESDSFSGIVQRTFRTTDILMKRVAELEEHKASAEGVGESVEPFIVTAGIETVVRLEELVLLLEIGRA